MGSDRSNAWPILIIVLSVVVAGVWKFAPIVYSWIPPSVFETIRRDAARTYLNRTSTPAEPASDSVDSTNDDNLIPTPTTTVEPCSPKIAAWGVLRRETTVKAVKGRKPLGTVKGGRFFVVGRRTGIDGETVVVGNFTPQAMDEAVYVPLDALACFTESPDDLTTEQRASLRSYFELEGEAAKISEKYLQVVAERSPYAKEAAKALKELRKLQLAARTRKFESEDDRQTAVYELSSQQLKVTELNQRHKEWKARHADELPDPEKDPEIISIRQRQQAFKAPIQHLLNW